MNTCSRRWIFLLFLLLPISGAAVESRPPIVPQGERIENVTEAMSDLIRLNGADDLAFGPEGKVLAAVDGSERVRLWRVPGGREMVRLAAPGENLLTVDISPDGVSGGVKMHEKWRFKNAGKIGGRNSSRRPTHQAAGGWKGNFRRRCVLSSGNFFPR